MKDKRAFRRMQDSCRSEIRQWNIPDQATKMHLVQKKQNYAVELIFSSWSETCSDSSENTVTASLRPIALQAGGTGFKLRLVHGCSLETKSIKSHLVFDAACFGYDHENDNTGTRLRLSNVERYEHAFYESLNTIVWIDTKHEEGLRRFGGEYGDAADNGADIVSNQNAESGDFCEFPNSPIFLVKSHYDELLAKTASGVSTIVPTIAPTLLRFYRLNSVSSREYISRLWASELSVI
ncbi:hypothetical protein CLF_112537 [Clonorchis sinensis]|uniref:Uncharacterized protein n=1 Tax=Clonorchis sinensis TaxID=79923 RepID=G7YWJ9_CLOSI|nr:hypothetical protein CLF_112537 [Clonorchis sinensis]